MWDLTENGLISPADQETEGEVILHPAPLVGWAVEWGQTLLRVHLSPGPGLGGERWKGGGRLGWRTEQDAL